MQAVTDLGSTVGIEAACDALGVARASFYRQPPVLGPRPRRPIPARALRPEERETVRALLNGERFQDCANAARCATLLDAGAYPCSISRARRRARYARTPRSTHASAVSETGTTGHRTEPVVELGHYQAARPRQVELFYLYVILDVFSRYVVGWMVALRETATLAKTLIEETCEKQNVLPGHALQTRGLPAGRSQRHQDSQSTLHFQRQSVFRKPLPHPEIPA